MLLGFVDETSDVKYKDYLGLCLATINATHYRGIKETFQQLLLESGWMPDVEFKGSYVFSGSKGCTDVPVDRRVETASRILDLTASEKNARIKFHYLRAKTKDPRETYLTYLPPLLKRALPKAAKKSGKDLIALHCDRRDDLRPDEIREAVLPALRDRGYTLMENVIFANSGFHTIGILYADLVCYLMGRIDTISADSELFDNITQEDFEKHGKLKKLRSSTQLISKVKRIENYVVKVEDT